MIKTQRIKSKRNIQHTPETMSDILGAYKVPTIILSIGLIIAILGFQWSLRQELSKSEKAFYDIADQIHQTASTSIRRHIQLVEAMGRIFGQIQDLSKEEFADISNVFSSSMNYTTFYFYEFTEASATSNQKDISNFDSNNIKEFFSSENEEKAVLSVNGLSEIVSAMNEARNTNGIYISRPFVREVEGDSDSVLVAVVSPVASKKVRTAYLVGILNVGAVFKEKLEPSEPNVYMRVFNVNGADKKLFFDSWADRSDEIYKTFDSLEINYMNFRGNLFWGNGINWQIVISPSFQSQIGTIGILPWAVFIGIIVITAMLSYIVFRITTQNIKAQMLVEEQTHDLRTYAERLEISNRDLDDFAYVASHDLKEPLRGLYTYAEILEEDYGDKLDAKGAEKLATLKMLAKRLEGFIESLFEYSKLSRIDFAAKETDIGEVLDEALDMLGIWLKENDAEVILATEFPKVRCDPVQTCEVFRNLITNGVKYNKNKNKIIEIGCILNSGNNSHVPVFWVKDNGIGIADEHKVSIFKIFKRLHERDEYGGGTGAGLTIVWKIIQRHGGKIWLESQKDEGTTFYFTLMRRKHDNE